MRGEHASAMTSSRELSSLVRSERKPLYVQVLTQPTLQGCWAVNISETGIGLIATSRHGRKEGPHAPRRVASQRDAARDAGEDRGGEEPAPRHPRGGSALFPIGQPPHPRLPIVKGGHSTPTPGAPSTAGPPIAPMRAAPGYRKLWMPVTALPRIRV